MITLVMYEELKNSYEENGYADLSYCVRVLQRTAQISPVDLCGTDGSIRDHLKMGRMLRQCFDGPFAGSPYTFASCAKNCERLRDDGRETDFYELFTTMDRTTHATFEKVLNGQGISASVLLRSTPHDHAERIWARYLNLSLRGLRDAELVLAPEEHRQEIDRFWNRLTDPYSGGRKIRRPLGEEGPPRVLDAFREYYRGLKEGLIEEADCLGYELLVGPFSLSGRHMDELPLE
ncbi:MAG: hypothetical protein IJG61_09480 [Lachnospiraceae bacterium]|nr:hypothetical protein [Lachnospiraceae bacterium]